jgi:hypothetical protein
VQTTEQPGGEGKRIRRRITDDSGNKFHQLTVKATQVHRLRCQQRTARLRAALQHLKQKLKHPRDDAGVASGTGLSAEAAGGIADGMSEFAAAGVAGSIQDLASAAPHAQVRLAGFTSLIAQSSRFPVSSFKIPPGLCCATCCVCVPGICALQRLHPCATPHGTAQQLCLPTPGRMFERIHTELIT